MSTIELLDPKPDMVSENPAGPEPGVEGSSTGGWSNSRVGRMLPNRMLKFAAVGAIGILVNLVALAFIQQVSGTRIWWTSLMANAIATFHNYIVNNLWTFRDQQRRGKGFFHGALMYFAVATIGIGVTTVCYGFFNHEARHFIREAIGMVPAWVAMACQLLAIVVGTSLNYFLNKTITWRLDTQPLE